MCSNRKYVVFQGPVQDSHKIKKWKVKLEVYDCNIGFFSALKKTLCNKMILGDENVVSRRTLCSILKCHEHSFLMLSEYPSVSIAFLIGK
jgi:hypothetical protein